MVLGRRGSSSHVACLRAAKTSGIIPALSAALPLAEAYCLARLAYGLRTVELRLGQGGPKEFLSLASVGLGAPGAHSSHREALESV